MNWMGRIGGWGEEVEYDVPLEKLHVQSQHVLEATRSSALLNQIMLENER